MTLPPPPAAVLRLAAEVSFPLPVAAFFQSMPSLPEGLTSETTAVLWLISLGVFVLLIVAVKGPAIVLAWRGTGNGKESARTDRLLEVVTAHTATAERKAAAITELASQVQRLNEANHNRIGPAISGLALAYLRLKAVDLAETADAIEEDEKRRGYPPARKP